VLELPCPPFSEGTLASISLDTAFPSDQTVFLQHWDSEIPLEIQGLYLAAWTQALSELGTPLRFLDGIEYHTHRFSVDEEDYLSSSIESAARRIIRKRYRGYFTADAAIDDSLYNFGLDLACTSNTQTIVPGVGEPRDGMVPIRNILKTKHPE
jgi:hypothetical protein